MALVIETGSGSATATSFVTDAFYVAWLKDRYPDFDRGAGSDRLPHLIRGADYLRHETRFRWRGTKMTAGQTLPYPRTGVVERRGLALADGIIPYRIMEAQCQAAYFSQNGTDLHAALARGGAVKSKTVGPISTTFMDNAPTETVFPFIVGILAPLLYVDAADDILRSVATLTDPVTVKGFKTGEFGAPAADSSGFTLGE